MPARRSAFPWSVALAVLLGVAAAYAQEGGSGPVPAPAPAPSPAPAPGPEPESEAGPQGAPQPAPVVAPDGRPLPAPGPGAGTRENGLRTGREQMWPAPTDADWEKPVRVTWQRSWPDALAVARETGRALLVCINMDGEIASEHYAGVRYRQPEIAALYEPYVCVIASVYRHTPRDYDDQGRRIPCPRFGGVTCGEHIAIEPTIYALFCDGQRVAPRHIMVELDGSPAGMHEVYDVYYRNDTASVFADIQRGIAERPPAPASGVRGDRPVVERVASRHVDDRRAVEQAYVAGDTAQREALLAAAARHADVAPLDLLRLAVLGLDPALSRSAREALEKVDDPQAAPLVAEALGVPLEAGERERLVATLKRLGQSSELARWLAVVHQGLGGRAPAVDPATWPKDAPPTYTPAYEIPGLPLHLEEQARAARAAPADAGLRLELAESTLPLALEAATTYASDPRRARMVERALLADARAAALEAARLGASGWRLEAASVLTAYYGGEREAACERAPRALAVLPAGDRSWSSMAVLTVFAEARWRAIKQATKERLDFPPEWLTDLHAAYAVLLKHPLGTEEQVLFHQDLMDWLGAAAQSERILVEGLARFPASPALHRRLRELLLRTKGPLGLEPAYDALRAQPDAPPVLAAYAGLAATAAAEALRNQRRLGDALAAYERAAARWAEARTADPTLAPSAEAAIALARAARARVLYQQGKDEAALDEILACFGASPASAGTRDGMGITPGETAQMLYARLVEQGKAQAAQRLEQALRALDQDLLRPDIDLLGPQPPR
ncbi:MAG: hypothetical protein ACKOSS_11175 [Planctomycetia bacterium]